MPDAGPFPGDQCGRPATDEELSQQDADTDRIEQEFIEEGDRMNDTDDTAVDDIEVPKRNFTALIVAAAVIVLALAGLTVYAISGDDAIADATSIKPIPLVELPDPAETGADEVTGEVRLVRIDASSCTPAQTHVSATGISFDEACLKYVFEDKEPAAPPAE